MIKKLFGILAAVALFGGVLMAQAGSGGGPGVMSMQAGPGPGAMQGPMFIRTQITRYGRNMMFRRRGMHAWWKNPMVAQRIGLSNQQKQQLDKIHQDGLLKMIDLRADLEREQVILGPMLKAYNPDEAQVLAQVDKVSEARAAISKQRIETMLASRKVLTEEQWEKLQDWRMGFHRAFGRRGFRHQGGKQMPAPPESK